MHANRCRSYDFCAWGTRWLATACLAAVALAGARASSAEVEHGNVILVSPDKGSDDNPGTIEAPFRTISAAIDVVQPGDTILLAAGVHKLESRSNFGLRIRRDGTETAPITMRGQNGEALLDCSDLTTTRIVYCLQLEADWWRISDVAVTGGKQNAKGAWVVGINLLNASNNVLKSVRSFRHEGPGIALTGHSTNNLIQDCEAFENYDPLSAISGGNADGVQIAKLAKGMIGNVVSRCHAYDNSDDGFDLWKTESPVTIEYSIASRNGFVPGTSEKAGDGVGFKLGKNSSGPEHHILFNRAIDNRAAGFDRNGAAGEPLLKGNIARGNGGGSFN